MPRTMQRITPFLWFDDDAEEAVKLYASIFKSSRIGNVTRYDAEGAQAAGRPVPTVLVELLQDKDPEKSKRVMAAMLKMKKIEIAALKRAYEGRTASAA